MNKNTPDHICLIFLFKYSLFHVLWICGDGWLPGAVEETASKPVISGGSVSGMFYFAVCNFSGLIPCREIKATHSVSPKRFFFIIVEV